jgi:hypothetical protein
MLKIQRSLGLVLVAAGALAVGCGDKAATTSASAEPAKSGAAANGSAKPAADAPKVAAAAAPGDALKYMPKECASGRVYLGAKKLFANVGDVGGLQTKILDQLAKSDKEDDKKATEVLAVFKEGGIDPVSALQEMAVCANTGNKVVVAISMDMGKVDKPADLFAKAMEKGSGKAPTKEEVDGVTYLTNEKGNVMGFPGGGVVLMADDKAAITAIAKGAPGGSEFADATSHLIWAKITEGGQNVDFAIKEAGDNLELKVVAAMSGPQGDALKKDPAGTIKQMESMASSMLPKLESGPLKAVVPAIKNAKFAAEGERLSVTSSFPKASLQELIKSISETSMQDLSRAL